MEYNARRVSSLETAPSSDNLPTRLLVLSLSVSHLYYTHGTLSYKSYSWQTLYRTLLSLTRLFGLTAIVGFWYLHYRGKAHLITDHERVIAWFLEPSKQASSRQVKGKAKAKEAKETNQTRPTLSIQENNPNKHAFSMRQQISALISTT
ncbi:hypothetical protein EAF04_006253 [Stromatinia cepivora]|nr:hypothetical protein EAF04_006253 [Stromatinia cepivora]